jgi:uncharacterized protein (DUF4415 family)
MAKEKRANRNSVSIKLSQKDLQAYRALGRGYTGIMSNILSRALKQPKLFRELSCF